MKAFGVEMEIRWGMIISGLLLAFFLQGCTTPLVNVDVKVGECAPGDENGIGLCQIGSVTPGQVYGGTTCQSGVHCKNENTTAGCPGRKRCKTVDQGGGDCVCQCK